MRFIFFTDSHIKAKAPEHRVDDYQESMLRKLREIAYTAKRLDVDCLFHGGDMFHTPYPPYRLIDEVVDILESIGKPIFCIVGNHDIVGHNPDTVEACALGHISRRSKLIQIMPPELGLGKCMAHSVHYSHNVEEYLVSDAFAERINRHENNLVFVHGMVLKNSAPFEHVLWERLGWRGKIIAYFLGHYHPPQPEPVRDVEQTMFVAPGALARLAALENNFERQVWFAFFDTSKLEGWMAPLETPKPGKEVFDVDKVTENKEYKGRVAKFLEALGNVKLTSLNVLDILKQVAEEVGESDDVVDEIIQRMEVVNE